MADFLNRTGPASVYTSARDNGNGEPITDTAGHIKTDSGIWVPMRGTENGELQVKISGAEDSSSGSLGVNIKQSEVMIPVDIQSRYTRTIQTHNAVSIGASSSSSSNFFSSDGFNEISITLLLDGGTASQVYIHWSHDGVNPHGDDSTLPGNSTGNLKAFTTSVKAKYFKVILRNNDASSSRIATAYAYLKS